MQKILGVIGVVGRVLLCAVFIAALAGYAAPDVRSVADTVAAKGMIGPTWALASGIFLLVLGCLSMILGYKARLGAALLLAFLALATFHFHGFSFWTLVDARARQEQIVQFTTNLSMMGAVLFILANGSGQMSLDAKRR